MNTLTQKDYSKLIYCIYLILILLFSFHYCNCQTNTSLKFIKGTYHKGYKSPAVLTYTVGGNAFGLQWKPPSEFRGVDDFMHTFKGNYLIGYDSLHPEGGKIFYNKPFFGSELSPDLLSYTEGIITDIQKGSCKYQYVTYDKEKSIYVALQCILPEDLVMYNIKLGNKYKVAYLKSKPTTAIIYFSDSLYSNGPLKDPLIVAFNGLVFNLGYKNLFLNANSLNNYLKAYSQPLINTEVPMFFLDCNQYYKSGFGIGVGIEVGKNWFAGNVNLCFIQKLSKRYYLNIVAQVSAENYQLKAFQNDEIKIVSDTSQYSSTNYSLKFGIELMHREGLNKIWNSRFLKIGAGVMIRLPASGNWKYEEGHDAINSKGQHYTNYQYKQTLYNMPSFEKYSFYITLSYSFGAWQKQ